MIDLLDPNIVAGTARAMTPVALAALGGLICARAGVFNVALEGMVLTGAFCGVVGSHATGSAFAGVLFAMLGAMLLAAVLAVGSVAYGGNAVVLGIALNLLAAGLTVFFMQLVFDQRGVLQPLGLEGIPAVHLPGIEDVPVLGSLLSGQSAVVFAMLVLFALAQYVLFRHRIGLRLRGAGENELAALSLGLNVRRYKIVAVLASGALGGLAGAQLALGDLRMFSENMSGGRGWIAVVAVIFGRNHPGGVLAACALFGFVDAVGIRLQGEGLASQITGAAPYLVTLLLLVFLHVRKSTRITEGMA
ncbi:ABC transporter permease [Streptomyces sp. NPDC055078]